ncbi:MAG: trypsin-like peptidase domain-containing protein [Clostridium sp.]|nr:trypsin-like peptidase domain-containing protein [Clostridium sp.]
MENNINNENNNENNIKNNKDVDINSTAENNHESLNTDDEILDAHENENTVVEDENTAVEDVDSCEDTITSDNTIACEDTITSDDTNNNDSLDKENNDSIKGKNGLFKAIAIVLIIGLLGGAVGGGSIYYVMKKQLNELSNRTVIANPQTFSTDSEALSASEAFEKVAPAVAIVSVSGVIDYSGIIPKETSGIGSGFIINEEGYILTNYHVIKGAKEVVVTLSDGTDANAKVVNYDENQDVAMLKISDDNIKVPAVVELGNSVALKPGEQVIAIGSPLSKEFGQTVTAGIVSATNRTVKTSSGVELNLIQTDTAINPGNSGGPLVNTKGEVVGINNMKLASDTIEGIGFSIPINSIKDRIDSLSKPILNLGISVREINSELGKQYNMDEGLYIVQVTEFSPAEKAGLQSGDLIVKFDGQRITTFNELKEIRDTKKEGDIVSIEIIRNGETKTVNLQLESKN